MTAAAQEGAWLARTGILTRSLPVLVCLRLELSSTLRMLVSFQPSLTFLFGVWVYNSSLMREPGLG